MSSRRKLLSACFFGLMFAPICATDATCTFGILFSSSSFRILSSKSSRLQGICRTCEKKKGIKTLSESRRKHLRLGPASKKRTRSEAYPCHLHSKQICTAQHNEGEKQNSVHLSILCGFSSPSPHHTPFTIDQHHNSGQERICVCDL